jgi:SAM-dependent methyltransferase
MLEHVREWVPPFVRRTLLSRSRRKLRRKVGTNLRTYQESSILYVRDRVGIREKRILELGGDRKSTVARAFRDLGCNWVTSINRDEGFGSPEAEDGIERLEMDARELRLPKDSYDLVFACAVLEHLCDLEVVLDNLHRVTRPGGHVVLQGSPLWNCHNGHHLWVNGPSGRKFRFNDNNPIGEWHHLLFEREQLQDELRQNGCEPGDAEAIVEWVYGTERINRYSATYLKQVFLDSKFSVVECREARGPRPPEDLALRLSKKHGLPRAEFSIQGLTFLVRK